eukprot:COSAG06_NODE_37612_length_433_cov_0.775449_1_plen_69_part_01
MYLGVLASKQLAESLAVILADTVEDHSAGRHVHSHLHTTCIHIIYEPAAIAIRGGGLGTFRRQKLQSHT